MKLNPKTENRNPKEFRSPNSERTWRASRVARARRIRPSDFSSRRAFTLIELILSIGIMAIVLLAINAVFFSAMRLHRGVTDSVEESLPLQQALSIMRRDLQGAMAPATEGVMSGSFRVGGVNSMGLGLPADIELYTTTGVLRENEPWGEIQKVAYQLRRPASSDAAGMDLFRCVTRNVLATMTPQPEEQFMLGGVESITFSCYDGAGWYDTWDSTLTTTLPSAVRVRILMANTTGGDTPFPFEMLIAIDSQVRPGTTSTNSVTQ